MRRAHSKGVIIRGLVALVFLASSAQSLLHAQTPRPAAAPATATATVPASPPPPAPPPATANERHHSKAFWAGIAAAVAGAVTFAVLLYKHNHPHRCDLCAANP